MDRASVGDALAGQSEDAPYRFGSDADPIQVTVSGAAVPERYARGAVARRSRCPACCPEPKSQGWHRLEKVITTGHLRGMEFVMEDIEKVTVVTPVASHIDAGNAAEFRKRMETVTTSSQFVVLALDKVEFLDSSGLGGLLSVLRSLSSKGGDLRLCGVSPQVEALLRLVRLDQIIQVFESHEEAVRSFGD